MLNQISPVASTTKTSQAEVIDLLVGCHHRIRHFTGVAVKLAHAQGTTEEEVRSAAEAVSRYYSVSLPLHEADEEDSMRPRLDKIPDEQVHHALAAMHDQHMAIDDLLERLLPLLRMVANNPALIGEAGGEMCSITSALSQMFTAHLQMEEEVIFPAIESRLGEHDRVELLAEMRARRQQGQ